MTKSIKGGRTVLSSRQFANAPGSAGWSHASGIRCLPSGRVDIWKVNLDSSDAANDGNVGFSVLSTDEVARANRFHFEKDRNHFSRCRSALRQLLADYLELRPDVIRFEYSANGKPHIIASQNARALRFNVSHSGGMALIAIGCEHRLGVDVEKIRTDVDTEALAERFFSTRERAALHALADELRVAGFYACWTRKEAFLKATGDGLSFPLADFSVTTDPFLNPVLDEVRDDEELPGNWLLKDINVPEGFRAAIAVDRDAMDFQTFIWPCGL